jgi:hypothetical protein
VELSKSTVSKTRPKKPGLKAYPASAAFSNPPSMLLPFPATAISATASPTKTTLPPGFYGV